MDTRILLLLTASLTGSWAFAEGCHVSQNTTPAQLPAVVLESCYEFTGVPADTINWSCSNESNQSQGSDKQKVARCKTDAVATCSAALTQESLANHRSTGDAADAEAGTLNLPAHAKVVTYFYALENRPQAKIDCESGGGTWKES